VEEVNDPNKNGCTDDSGKTKSVAQAESFFLVSIMTMEKTSLMG